MIKYLLDTNIISELIKPEPNSKVIGFISELDIAWISTITTHELDYGLFLLAEGKKRDYIHNKLGELISKYKSYILPVDQIIGEVAATVRAIRKGEGKPIALADALIAATAKINNLTIVTRNTKDFEGLDIELLNPFSS